MKTIIDFANKVKSLADGRISNIANVEGATSAHPYTVGKQLIFNGLLCKATSAIAVGDTLAVGTNLALSDNVVEQIYSLNQGLTNSLANISHENLLDNPWFTVNQRGFTSDSNPSAGTHLVDRWAVRYNPSSGAVTVADNIVTLTSNGGLLIIGERFEENVGFSGKTMTASIMLSDGTIYSGTGVFPSKNGADKIIITTDDFSVYFQYSANSGNYPMLGITCKANKTLAIKAVKLELGSVSTLAMDSAPNYATELLKCQRYFYRMKATAATNWMLFCMAWGTSSMNYIISTPVEMRSVPTVTVSNIANFIICKGASTNSRKTGTSINCFEKIGTSIAGTINVSETDLVFGDMYVIKAGSADDYINFFADL